MIMKVSIVDQLQNIGQCHTVPTIINAIMLFVATNKHGANLYLTARA